MTLNDDEYIHIPNDIQTTTFRKNELSNQDLSKVSTAAYEQLMIFINLLIPSENYFPNTPFPDKGAT